MNKREIKFRAWTGERMVYDGDAVYPKHFSQRLMNVTDPCKVYHDRIEVEVHESSLGAMELGYFDHPSYVGFVAIMQFTGLKDKNGREIYEGDIVRHIPTAFNTRAAQGEVYWFADHVRFAMKTNGDEHYLDSLNTYEVIGNIHENPELLKP